LMNDTRESLMNFWESGWQAVFDALEPLQPEDFSRTVTIRGEPHTIIQAINRQLTHYAYHVGQIVFLAKHFKASDWKTLSVPRNQSKQFNEYLAEKQAAGEGAGDRFDSAVEFAEKSGHR